MDQPLSEPSSDNEEINKLFPRCRPRISNDFNQNNVIKDRKLSSSPHGSDSTMSSMDKVNDNYIHEEESRHSPAAVSDMSETSSCCEREEPHQSRMDRVVTEDHSVISAYDYCDFDNSLLCNSKSDHHSLCDQQDYSEDVIYDNELDVGYHLDSGSNFCIRESRIEIAGGREIFSKSRSKPSKKRHSEEMVYHRQKVYEHNNQNPDYKRFSADVMYDEKLRRYTYNMCTGSVDRLHSCSKLHSESDASDKKGSTCESRVNGRSVLRKSSSVKGLQELPDPKQHALSSGHLVYEAPVRNAEVVYDDIGELICQQKLDNNKCSSSNELHVKTSTCDQFSNYRGEILESPNSDKGESFQIMHKPHIGIMDVCSPVSPSVTLWNEEGLQDHHESSRNLCQEEDMDTESEPSSPAKLGIARLIGNVPIAEYEGSPRRYGPRPGYPQRVMAEINEQNPENAHPSTCEELLKVISGEANISQVSSAQKVANDVGKHSGSQSNSLSSSSEDHIGCNSHESESKHIGEESDSRQNKKEKVPKLPSQDSDFSELEYRLYRVNTGSSYVGRRLAHSSGSDNQDSPKHNEAKLVNGDVAHIKSGKVSPRQIVDENSVFLPNEQELMLLHESVHQHTLQVEMVEQDLESVSTYPGTEDLGETEVGEQVDHTRNFTLSPETTDCDSNDIESVVSLEESMNSGGRLMSSMPVLEDGLSSGHSSDRDDIQEPESSEDEGSDAWSERKQSEDYENPTVALINKQISKIEQEFCKHSNNSLPSEKHNHHGVPEYLWRHSCNSQHLTLQDVDLSYFDVLAQKQNEPTGGLLKTQNDVSPEECNNSSQDMSNVSEAIKEIKQAIQLSKNVQLKSTHSGKFDGPNQPVWVPRLSQSSKSKDGCHSDSHGERNVDEEDCDTDQETDRLLGAQRTDDKGFYDDKSRNSSGKKKSTSKEVLIHEPAVLIEGVLFRARYLGSTQLVCEGQPTKATRMMQAEEAVSRIKAPEGETQPSTEVDLFISTEKIMVLNTDLKEIMMDHALRAISYIADIGDLVVLMARRRVMNSPDDPNEPKIKRTPKMICHVFESEEAQFIAQSIGQAFQVAYMEFLKANGIEDSSFVKEMDYQEVLNSQEIFGNELEMFAKKEKQKEVVVPKQKGEILGMVIVESGWGSMLPTVVIANMAQSGPAARCGQLNIGDQIIAINGISLVGLPLSTCQNYIKNTKNQTVVKLTVVPCAPVVEVKIKRPDTKYQLGFSVQNGVICSLLRGGIAERGGVRVGHRIIEINGQSVVAVPHEKIVNLLATSVGEIHMKTMPTSMFRLLTGQESPLYI